VDRSAGTLMTGENDVEPLAGVSSAGPEPQHAGEAVSRFAFSRHSVDLGFLDELEAVLDRAQEAIGDRQRGSVLGCDVAGIGELGEGGEGCLRRRAGSRPPWTSWRSCTENSTSRIHPSRLSSRWSRRGERPQPRRALSVRSSASSSPQRSRHRCSAPPPRKGARRSVTGGVARL